MWWFLPCRSSVEEVVGDQFQRRPPRCLHQDDISSRDIVPQPVDRLVTPRRDDRVTPPPADGVEAAARSRPPSSPTATSTSTPARAA